MENEKTVDEMIQINDKILHFGVLSDENGYQVYTYPGMTISEMAFDVMVTIRLMIDGGYLEDKESFIELVNKYYDDPQYQPIEKVM